jgi:hypothetical protein
METFTEDRQVVSPALWRVWEQKDRLRGKAHAGQFCESRLRHVSGLFLSTLSES